MAASITCLEAFFISKVRIKLLKYFVFHPDVPIHLRGAVREVSEEINAVRRELLRMVEIGFLKMEESTNRKYYSMDPDFIFLHELEGLFHKTFGLGGKLLENASRLGHMQFAILMGAYINARNAGTQNVDLVIIGEIDLPLLSKIIEEIEKNLGREINYTVLKTDEFNIRKKRRDGFIMEMMVSPKIILAGREQDLMS